MSDNSSVLTASKVQLVRLPHPPRALPKSASVASAADSASRSAPSERNVLVSGANVGIVLLQVIVRLQGMGLAKAAGLTGE
jgi:hypothetical protein